MRKTLILILIAFCCFCCAKSHKIEAVIADTPISYCNPLDLNYRFSLEAPGSKEAADPVVQYFDGTYYLFASKSGGYWKSEDFSKWDFIPIAEGVLSIEEYAPATFVYDGYLYFVGSNLGGPMLCRSKNPESGVWEKVKRMPPGVDPACWVEGDTLYYYYGCSPKDPLYLAIVDLKTFEQKGEIIELYAHDTRTHGWERPGELNELGRAPYMEGSWMNKHNGKYYLQYAAPGTEWRSYADGVLVSDNPTGPFVYASYSPFSYRPSGFSCGSGHSTTFNIGDDYWRVSTSSISVKHMFERRLHLNHAGFDKDGQLYCDTYLGDFPKYLPGVAKTKSEPLNWMLLSYKKPVTVSSQIDTLPAGNAADEDIRTFWVAASADTTEWLMMDLEKECDINAVQVNFAEYGSMDMGRDKAIYQNYIVEASHDGVNWSVVIDRSDTGVDAAHSYTEFAKPFKARYLKVKNCGYTAGTNFSLRDLRVFGNGGGVAPALVQNVTIDRDAVDSCLATVAWDKAKGADGYVIRYGIAPDKLYNSIQVMGDTSFKITSLNAGQEYFFVVDSFNDSGITMSK